jgi:PAS domain S-box-containing protein
MVMVQFGGWDGFDTVPSASLAASVVRGPVASPPSEATLRAFGRDEENPAVLAFPVVRWRMDAQGRITEISPNVQASFGWAREEIIGRFADSFIGYVDRQRATDVMFACASAGEDWVDETFLYIAKGGALIPMTTCGTRLSDARGDFFGFEGTMRAVQVVARDGLD